MKKIISTVVLLFVILNLKSQYFTNISTSTFYNSTSTTNDLHFDEGWVRDTSSIQLINGEIEVRIRQNSSGNITTGFISLLSGDIIFIDHKVSNASNAASLSIYYVDSFNNNILAKTINYSSANIQSMTDTVNVTKIGSYKIRLEFSKTTGNNQQHFHLMAFSVYNPLALPYIPSIKRLVTPVIDEDSGDIINVFDITNKKIFEGYLIDFYKIADKNKLYIINDKKIIIY